MNNSRNESQLSAGTIQVPADHYLNSDYDTKGRFSSYWHQVNEIKSTGAKSILEVGMGNGFTSQYLSQRGLQIDTLDIDPELNPTFVGSVTSIPIDSNSYDCVVCYEVLEHMPFDCFFIALSELCRISKKWVIISLPDASRSYRILARLPLGLKIKWRIPVPNIPARKLPESDEHFWEIGTQGFPLSRIESVIGETPLIITKTYRVFEHIRHRFFIMSK